MQIIPIGRLRPLNLILFVLVLELLILNLNEFPVQVRKHLFQKDLVGRLRKPPFCETLIKIKRLQIEKVDKRREKLLN